MLFREQIEDKYKINTKKYKEWEDFSEAIKKGKVLLKLKYNTNIFKNKVLNSDNKTFFQGIVAIKYIVGLAWILIYLFSSKDFLFLITLPLIFIVGILIELNFSRRTLVAIIFVLIIIFSGVYFSLNWNWYIFPAVMILLNTWSHKIYDDFLSDQISDLEYMFMDAVEENIITKIIIK